MSWTILALIGAFILNPVCVLIFAGGCALEAIYCLLWRVSPFRTFVSGAVKTSGAVAAVFAVDPDPSGMLSNVSVFNAVFLGNRRAKYSQRLV